MTDVEPPVDRRRQRRRWIVGGAVAAAAVIAVAVIVFGFLGRPGTPMAPGSPAPANTTAPTDPTTLPSDGASPTESGTSPTTPVVPGEIPSPKTPASPLTPSSPRQQPTENEDSEPRVTKDPIEITAEATPEKGIEARLVSIESVEGEAVIPGEVGGPALRITLEVTNNTSEDFATPAVVVNLYKGKDLSPAGPLLNPGGKAFPDKIAPGDSAQGIYLFTLSLEDRKDVTIEVDLAIGTPILLFSGSVS